MANDVAIVAGSAITVKRLLKGGWYITGSHGGAGYDIAFTDSVDLLMWLGDVLPQSDGGKKMNSTEEASAGGFGTAPAPPG